ncbi:GlsB/YeaQ/YmgE family stress response membrane protein [Actinomadura atramentaria]|uniref:GlsB/YeaQ/YmgE family stress response membrane protein n=1 Tax=Actinomadura atramentaria TaxID=1990 RepID=UPI000366932E|nr:GlsB/YeaQ/YmgE family stress response membrane protein [Actinomadura atramentaria]
MVLTVLWFIIVGAVIGALARLVVPGRNPIGILLTILVGIVGSILGGVVANALGAGSVLAFVFAVVIAALGVAALTTARGGHWGRSY